MSIFSDNPSSIFADRNFEKLFRDRMAITQQGANADTTRAAAGMMDAQTSRSLAPSRIALDTANAGNLNAVTAEVAPNAAADRAESGARTRFNTAQAIGEEQFNEDLPEDVRRLIARAQGLGDRDTNVWPTGLSMDRFLPRMGFTGTSQPLSFNLGTRR